MPDEELDDKIKEAIERKVEEKLQEETESEGSEGILDTKIKEKIQQLTEKPEKNGVDRRNFLKMLGLGAGGLALASPAAAWFSVADNTGGGGSTQTLSDVLGEGNDIDGQDIVDGGTTVWDSGNSYIPVGAQESETPSGTIAIWYGSVSDIPSGWVLCDGNNSTPDLQDRFVVGAGSSYSVDNTGGSQTHTLSNSEMASHTHGGSTSTDGSHTHDATQDQAGGSTQSTMAGGYDDSNLLTNNAINSAGSHNHSLNDNSAGSDSAHENRPPYHALAYIMKS